MDVFVPRRQSITSEVDVNLFVVSVIIKMLYPALAVMPANT